MKRDHGTKRLPANLRGIPYPLGSSFLFAGWIHTLLEEAENERVHLLTFMQLRDPPAYMRAMVLLAQGCVLFSMPFPSTDAISYEENDPACCRIFFNMYFLAYMLNPNACHRFVGYLEEEAVKTYSRAIEDIDNGTLKHWADMPAPGKPGNVFFVPIYDARELFFEN